MATNVISNHVKELLDFKIQQKREWNELLKSQEKELAKNDNVAGLAERFAKEREEHNKRFEKARKEVIDRQQKEMEQSKQTKKSGKKTGEMEM